MTGFFFVEQMQILIGQFRFSTQLAALVDDANLGLEKSHYYTLCLAQYEHFSILCDHELEYIFM